MENYSCEKLKKICRKNEISPEHRSKKEMYEILIDKGVLKCPCFTVLDSPLHRNREGKIIHVLDTCEFNKYKQKYYLGEEFRMNEFCFE